MSMDWHAHDFTRNHVRLRYWRKGNPNGAPVLLLHGITDSGCMWGRVADGLAEQGFAVIAPDQRGHGESDVPDHGYAYDDYAQDAIALLSYLDKSPAIVMGHSFGGLISMWLGAHYPQVVSMLVLVDPPLFNFTGSDEEWHDWRQSYFQWLRDMKPKSAAQIAAEKKVESPGWSDDEREHYAQARLAASLRLSEQGGVTFYSDWQELFVQFQCPTLLLYGDKDLGSIISDETADQARQLLRFGQVVKIPNTGHSLLRDDAPAFIAAVLPFVTAETPVGLGQSPQMS